MSTKINPPSYNPTLKTYELYKQELLAWREVTELEKKKQGVVIALSLPENDESKIREKVFDQIKLDDLKKDDGLDTLVQFLDKHLAKDDLVDSLEKFEDFEDFKRSEGQSINEYISVFDTKYRKIEKKNMRLPSEILAFKLLRRANLSKEEKMVVLTGMNFENRVTLYEEAKTSLKKFKGETCDAGGNGTKPGQSIKLEPAFLADHEEALLAAGYTRVRPERFVKHNFTRGRGYNSQGRGFSRGQRGGKPNSPRGLGADNSKSLNSGLKKSVNPTGPDGSLLTCKSCGSYRHLMAACPHSWENMSKVNICDAEEDVVLFTGYIKEDVRNLGKDARNCAVLDSACSSTVCSKTWMDSYLDSLSDEDKDKVSRQNSTRIFKFGGGTKLQSQGEYAIPAYIAGKEVTIKTDIVESDIPLLLSRTAMKTAGVKMDLENDTAEILGKSVSLNLTSSGHYCIPIDKADIIHVEEVHAVQIETLGRKQRYATLLKLHRQFAHPPRQRLVSLLKDAGAWHDDFDEDLIDIERKCDVCKQYARTPSRPVVSFPMASRFNEKVAMDLKKWKDRWILHMIDMWSRYTVSVFIERKKTTDVIEKVMSNWIGVFGVMGAIMTDNGGEFSSDEMREVASILNVKLCTSAAESPFQNGLCERVHAVTDMMLVKLEGDYSSVNEQSLLSWANMARNALQMWNGFSSHQLVFGWNPNLPNIMTDKLPALDGHTSSEILANHLNLLHDTRRAYIEVEADERIRRALLSKVRAAEEVYKNGDMVYYKREGKEKWLGPGKVVFQDGKVVFVRHGGIFVRVSPNRLQKVDTNSRSDSKKTVDCKDNGHSSDKSFVQPADSIFTETLGKSLPAEENEISDITPEPIHEQERIPSDESEQVDLKAEDEIQYKLENEDWIEAVILGRAGKAKGKHKNWYNVRDSQSKEERSLDLGRLCWKKIDRTENIYISAEKDCDDRVFLAKQCELEKLRNFATYEEVEDIGQKKLSTRWVITEKENQVKARLVARGFEENFYVQRDSPTVGKGALKVFLFIAAGEEWTVKTTDIKSAFLQGKEIDRDVFLKPPVESNTKEGIIWKLKHCLYGLKDGARQFYLSVKEELMKLGFVQCSIDPTLFYIQQQGKLTGMICSHVDDFLHAGDCDFEKLMDRFRKRFYAGKVADRNFLYIGFEIRQDNESITLDHTDYMKKLRNVELDPQRMKQKGELLDPGEQTIFRQIIGQLNWAVQGSRPDLAFDLIDLSTKLNSASVGDLIRGVKTINRLRDVHSEVKFPALNLSSLKILTFTDASLGNLNNGTGSTHGSIAWICDNSGKCCPLFWQSKKIKRVVRSTLAAEALSLQEGLEASVYFRHLIEEILGLMKGTIDIYAFVDNKSVIESVYSTKLVDDKRLRIDIAALAESIQKNEIKQILWCPGQKQLANCLTKAGASGVDVLQILHSGHMISDFIL